jgi:hypothetical protein
MESLKKAREVIKQTLRPADPESLSQEQKDLKGHLEVLKAREREQEVDVNINQYSVNPDDLEEAKNSLNKTKVQMQDVKKRLGLKP